MNNPDLHVLIVGIDSWINPKLPPLKGCVNDAKLMQSVFRDRFGVAEENIAMLTNEDATRDGITTAFRSHLIDRARQLAGQQQSGVQPSFVFCFAGHGSRTKDRSGTQPDGMDETIVPYDSRTGEVYDIKDWELASWLDELTSYTSNVTVNLCGMCSAGCTRCISSSFCLRCQSGLTLFNFQCSSTQQNYYEWNNGSFLRCPAYCITCRHRVCSRCDSGWVLDQG